MHHFPWHVGDYISHTAHLTHMEDLAYRRLLDFYYLHEKPIPVDLDLASKKIRMAEHRDAVQSVLDEFFDPSPDGWRHGRADEELQEMRERQDHAEERDEHEKTRSQKHRERRSAMFAALREVGIYPAFNAKTGDLERLISEHCDADATQKTSQAASPVPLCGDATCDGTCDTCDALVTASRGRLPTPTPTPTPVSKEDNLTVVSPRPGDERAADLLGDEIPKGLPDCPHREVLAVWAEVLPEMPQHLPAKWAGTRAAHLRARWREEAAERKWTTQAEGLAFFRKFLGWCRRSPFLMGKVQPRPGHRAFEFELEWLVNPSNWAKVHEGKYHGES